MGKECIARKDVIFFRAQFLFHLDYKEENIYLCTWFKPRPVNSRTIFFQYVVLEDAGISIAVIHLYECKRWKSKIV